MRWFMRRVDQGQMIEVAYAYDGEGGAYRRVTDHTEPPGSEWRLKYYRGDLDWEREPEGTDTERAPCVVEWVPCEPPKEMDPIENGTALEEAEAPAVLDRLRAAAEGAEAIGWAGPEREIACLRELLASEEDPAVRARMQRRLDEVLALGDDADPTRGES